jgi:hypothetical protein
MQCSFESCEILLAPQSQSIDFGRRVVLNKDRASPFTIHVLMDGCPFSSANGDGYHLS